LAQFHMSLDSHRFVYNVLKSPRSLPIVKDSDN
jgi:hypothetical protein